MPTYYKYAERNADSQVNWAEIGKGVSDMIKEETDIRTQKKAAIDESTRQFQNMLASAPQGEFQDGNKFTNNFAHDMMAQQLIDTRLLKSGQMKLQDFTLRRQNYIDGTNQLFDLQKLYQDNYKSTMEGVNSGDLQAMNTYNMSSIEGFSDFSKSKAIINPYTGIINVGMMKANAQGVMELTNDVAPVNVLRGKILSKIPTFRVDDAMNNTVKTLGKDIDYIYKAATTSGAGSVTKLLGIGAFEDLKKEHPEIKNFGDYKGVIENANSAIDKTIDGYFADPYHISSVLTQNTGKYHFDSYTYDKNEAAKDPTKLLLKINPNTGLGILDEKAPNYKNQVNEARNWVKTELLSKLDKERSLTVTPQNRIEETRPKTGAEYEFEQKKDDAKIFGQKMADVVSGNTAEETQLGVDYFNTLPGVNATKQGKTVTIAYTDTQGNTDTQNFELLPNGGFKNAHDVGVTMAKLLNKQGLPEQAVAKAMDDVLKGRPGGTTFTATNKKSAVGEQDYTSKLGTYANEKLATAVEEDKPESTVKNLTRDFGKLGYKFKGETRGWGDDAIQIQAPNGTMSEWINIDDLNNVNKISDFIKKNKDDNILIKSGLFPSEAEAAKAKECVNGKDKFGNPC